MTGRRAARRPDEGKESTSRSGESNPTVLLALAANAGVGVLKLAAGLLTGSSALLSEAAHSAGDCTTELLLLVALRNSGRPADRSHPFGYGKERYFWSLLAAVAIFVSGSAFSMYEGLSTIFGGHDHASGLLWLNYPVLALAFVMEGLSFRQAAGRVRATMRRHQISLRDVFRDPRDPTINSVALEDSTALVGLLVAALGVGLHQLTGSSVWDGAASLVIGLLLLTVAVVLARACEGLLIGKQADPRLLRAIESWLEDQAEIDDVVDLLTMITGSDRVLLCVRADFVDTSSAGDLERACLRVDTDLRAEFPELDEIFIQPASRGDTALRERVRERYGRPLADE
jgi:cation diffusion facilitator family transporter